MSDAARAWAKRLGAVGAWSFDVERLRAEDARAYARDLESLGMPTLWIPESLGSKEAFAHASLLLAATKKLIIATGIANIWARDPVAMANGQRALVDAYPDRFLLGVGVSHAPVLKARGQSTYERPLEHMRDYLEAMDKAPYTGGTVDMPRVVAALGPKMLQLSARRSLGAHPYFVPVEHTTLARKELGDGPLLAVEQAAVLSTDATVARATARRHMKRYLELDNYANNLRRIGWADADIANGGSDALVDAIVVWGHAGAIRKRADDHLARGADHVAIQVIRVDVAAPASQEWRTLAPALLKR
ncbi:MAG TPA: TIGR03620 family F420-dependent LLM class oxidoreductase [Candidatus Limnocylindrales bacterium]|nr:TIGR03620 family F420-dependent LLM class oxidoreductase [Candidatus Limnocylindrales bacterium]